MAKITISIPAGETYTTVKEMLHPVNGVVAIFYGCNSEGDKPGFWVEAQGANFFSKYVSQAKAEKLYSQYSSIDAGQSPSTGGTAELIKEAYDTRNGCVELYHVGDADYQVYAARVNYTSDKMSIEEAEKEFEKFVNNSQRQ